MTKQQEIIMIMVNERTNALNKKENRTRTHMMLADGYREIPEKKK